MVNRKGTGALSAGGLKETPTQRERERARGGEGERKRERGRENNRTGLGVLKPSVLKDDSVCIVQWYKYLELTYSKIKHL